MGRACGTHGGDKKYNILVGKTEGKRPFRRRMRKWEGNIKIVLI
jgi:hypothetical protein